MVGCVVGEVRVHELPAKLSESDVLDFVEGVHLAPDVAVRIAAAMAADAAFAGWVQALRADRAALIAMPAAKTPAGLLEAVESQLDSEVLVSAARVEHAARGPVPVVVARPLGPGVLARIGRSPMLALAAMLAMAAGAMWLAVGSTQSAKPARTPTSKANPATGPETLRPVDGPDATTLSARAGDVDGTEAGASGGLEAAAGAAVEQRLAEAGAPEPNEQPGTLMARPAADVASVAAPHPWGLPLDRALTLAAEGRLLIEIDSAELDRTATRLEGLTRASSAVWHVRRHDAPASSRVVALERSRIDAAAQAERTLAQDGSPRSPRSPRTFDQSGESGAATGRLPPLREPARGPAASAAPPAVLPGTFEAQMPATEPVLEALLRRLSGVGRQRAQLVELDPVAAEILRLLPAPGDEFVGPPPEFAHDTVSRVAVPIVVRER